MKKLQNFFWALFMLPMGVAMPAMAQPVTYTITAGLESTGGAISPSGAVTVNSGANQTFTITVNSGYEMTTLAIDNDIQATPLPTAVPNVFLYTFNNVTASHQIEAYFYTSSPSGGAPQITQQPASQSVGPGSAATFSVVATGGIAPNYQWYESTNGGGTFNIISGANSASYATSAVSSADNGTEFVCEVYNDYALVATVTATLTVLAPTSPYVKVQGRQLVADFTGTGKNYHPFVIRGVDYSPTPIGRYSSDWGYYVNSNNPNPNKLPNDMFADPNILSRDFSLLQQMNANTIRIWQGEDDLECSVTKITFENAFPNSTPAYGDNIYDWLQQNGYLDMYGQVVANLSSSASQDALQANFTDPGEYNIILNRLQSAQSSGKNCGRFPNMITTTTSTPEGTITGTLDTAAQYNLKVIAGFWISPIGYFNCSTSSCQYELNLYNGESNDPGLNTGFDITNSYIRNDILTRFENYVKTFKNRPEILFWAIGNENNLSLNPNDPAQIKAWYSLVNQMAGAAHQIEGSAYHPVAVVNGDIGYIGDASVGADDQSLPNVDIWGANTYRGQSFNDYFIQYKALSTKPLWISEYGIDAWQSCDTTKPATCDPNNPSGSEDQADQSTWDGGLWNEVAGNGDITIGASMMEYSDEWWKPYDWICTYYPYTTYAVPVGNATYCQQNHFHFGEGPGSDWPLNGLPYTAPAPDNYFNEAWWGLMEISNTSPQTQPDTMTPRAVYTTLKAEFASNAAIPSYLASPVKGTVLSSTSIPFAWSLGRGVSQYQLLVGSTAGGNDIYSYTGTATSATVTGIPLTGKTIYVQLGSYINGAWQSSNYSYQTAATVIVPVLNGTLVDTLSGEAVIDIIGQSSWNSPQPTATGPNGVAELNPGTFPNFQMYNLVAGTYNLSFNLQGSVLNYSFTISANSPYNYSTLKIPVPLVKASAGTGGSISPSGVYVYTNGARQTFTITPSAGYSISQLFVDGAPVTSAPSTYTISNIAGAHTIAATFAPKVVVPPPPTALTGGYGYGNIILFWNGSAGAAGYIVKQGTKSGVYTTSLATKGTSYSEPDPLASRPQDGTVTYYYAVEAVNTAGTSVNSNEISILPVVQPTGVTATAGNGQVVVKWNASAGATGYIIYRSSAFGQNEFGSTVPSYTDTAVTNGTTYSYSIQASNPTSSSYDSDAVSATPLASAGILATMAISSHSNARGLHSIQ